MPICSYLVYPVAGKSAPLKQALESLSGCEVRKAENRDVFILLTDTPDSRREEELQEKLKTNPHIQCLAMTFAAMDDDAPGAAQDAPFDEGRAHLEEGTIPGEVQ